MRRQAPSSDSTSSTSISDWRYVVSCHGAKYDNIALLLDKFEEVSVSKRNAHGKLPTDLLWESRAMEDRESVGYIECVFGHGCDGVMDKFGFFDFLWRQYSCVWKVERQRKEQSQEWKRVMKNDKVGTYFYAERRWRGYILPIEGLECEGSSDASERRGCCFVYVKIKWDRRRTMDVYPTWAMVELERGGVSEVVHVNGKSTTGKRWQLWIKASWNEVIQY